MHQLKYLKKIYDVLGNDQVRAYCLKMSEKVGIRKDIIRMDTNNLCNIECIMCNHKAKTNTIPVQYDKNPNIMSFEDYQHVLNLFGKSARMLYLSCGHEPLMTPHFEKYISYAKKKNIPFISLCTNAMLLHDKIIKCLVDEQIDEIIISFNGLNEDDYNRIMKKSNYQKVMSNLKNLVAYKKLKNSQYPKIRLNSIMMKSNMQDIEKFIDFVHEYDIDKIQFRELGVYSGQNNPEEVDRELISNLSASERDELLKKIHKTISELKKVGRELIIPNSLFDKELLGTQHISNRTSCSIPYFSYWIEQNGLVKSCIYASSNNSGHIGNIFSDDMKIIKRKRDIFRKNALTGSCGFTDCKSNIHASDIL